MSMVGTGVWIAIGVMAFAGILGVAVIRPKRPVDVNDLGRVSEQWMAQNVDADGGVQEPDPGPLKGTGHPRVIAAGRACLARMLRCGRCAISTERGVGTRT